MVSARILFAAAALCFLFAFAAPTMALAIGEDSASDDVVFEPVDERYATIENGNLTLDIGVYGDAMTTIEDVFTIRIGEDADDIGAIWIDHDVDGVTFYAGGSPITDESRLEPAPGETVTVGVSINTHIAPTGTKTFTVHAISEDETENRNDVTSSPPGGVTVESLSVDPHSLETGQTVTVNATYRNFGETETITPRLTVDGTVVDQRSIDLEPGETETVSFERRMDWPGAYEVGIAGVGTESVTVEGPPIDVVDATIDDAELTAGESTAVRATVRNPTNTAVDRTLEVAVDGTVVDSRAVTIPANGERTVVFERRFDEVGTYEIGVSGVGAGTVTVSEPETFSIRNRELSAAIAPPATAGLLFLAMAANRRWAFVQ
ncbi:CARDB domain-containing protein [Natrinema versiforme]|uniref:CARDB domain-containing protein n=1 Tax=Natrinema versiforme TaxID=88724 RepID=A0A4V1FXY4_9EURY|nr:hypothetical protein FEJ81_01770 [Natrinema versiforme]